MEGFMTNINLWEIYQTELKENESWKTQHETLIEISHEQIKEVHKDKTIYEDPMEE